MNLAARLRRDAELVRMLVPRELRTRYRQSFLTVAWAVIAPVATLAVYGFILTRSFDVSASCGPYLSSAWIGLVLWTFAATAVGGAVSSLLSSADLMARLYFPREAIPLAVTGAAGVDLGVGALTIALVLGVQRVPFQAGQLWVVLPFLVVVVWTAAVSVLVAALATFARDVVHGVHLALRLGFFATPVMYEASVLPRALAWTATANPLAVGITGARRALLCGASPDLPVTMAQLGIGTAALVAVLLYVRAVESRIVDVV